MIFKPEIFKEIKYYVYAYSDPDTKIPFYIGKGKGNRCFEHLDDQSESSKVVKLKDLKENQKKPLIELLRYGLTNDEASLIEATLIDFAGLDLLTNRIRGLHSRSLGRTFVEDIILKYSAEDVAIKNDKAILISVGKSYNARMSEEELYEYSRGVWRVNENRHRADFALVIFQGIIREVYKISKWHKAGSLLYKYRDTSSLALPNRREFEGAKAEEYIREKYIGKSVRKYFPKGSRNPIKYVNC